MTKKDFVYWLILQRDNANREIVRSLSKANKRYWEGKAIAYNDAAQFYTDQTEGTDHA